MAVRKLFVFAALILGVLLVISIVRSGFLYQFDGDEYYHAQVTYLLANGTTLYRSFFFYYTPLFHFFLLPWFFLFGFTFKALSVLRVVMIGLFVLRIAATVTFLSRIFNRRTALLFAPLILLDPFTVFAGMQIRPDNLMLLAYLTGLAVLEHGLRNKKVFVVFLGGTLFGLALVILLKSAPLVAAAVLVVGLTLIARREARVLIALVAGIAVPIAVLGVSAAVTGILPAMLQSVVWDPLAVFQSLQNPVYPSFFFAPHNPYIFGVGGKPLPWLYAWLLPILAGSGIVHLVLVRPGASPRNTSRSLLSSTLAATALIQWIAVLYAPSSFIQYFLPVNWFFAIFGAVLIDAVLAAPKQSARHASLVQLVMVSVFLVFAAASIRSNEARSHFTSQQKKQEIMALWQAIPPNEPVFPNLLFRPLGSAVIVGVSAEDLPWPIRRRYPDVAQSLENPTLRYAYLSAYARELLPLYAQKYLASHFTPSSLPNLFIRKQ